MSGLKKPIRRFTFMLPMIDASKLFIFFIVCLTTTWSKAQTTYTILEDDEYNFSVQTPTEMTQDYEILQLEKEVKYVTYTGNLVNSWDTFYYRIDIWENPIESDYDLVENEEEFLDSTLLDVEQRLRGVREYAEPVNRNGWPARLARYDIPGIHRKAKVLLVKRRERYYLLTVVMAPSSTHSKAANQFIHSFKIWE